MDPVGHLEADVIPLPGLGNLLVIDLHRTHGLVEVLMRTPDMDHISESEMIIKDDNGYADLWIVMSYPPNHSLHRQAPFLTRDGYRVPELKGYGKPDRPLCIRWTGWSRIDIRVLR